MTRSEREEKLRAVPLDAAKELPIAANSAGCADDDDVSWADVMLMIPPPHRAKVLNELCRRAHEATQLAAELERLTPPPSRPQRIAARDRAIRRAVAEYYRDAPKTVAAGELAFDLKLYAQGEFRHGKELPNGASAHRHALREILKLNKGSALSKSSICEIL